MLTVLDIARRTTDWLGVDFHPIHMDEPAMASTMEDVVWYSECPLADVNGMGRLAMAKKAHERGLKVILTGKFFFFYLLKVPYPYADFLCFRRGLRRALCRL